MNRYKPMGMKEMVKQQIKNGLFRLVRLLVRPFYGKGIWLVSDRKYVADDNGEALFRFLQKEKVRSVFALSKDSRDYERVSKIGETVRYDSFKHKLLLCTADVNISSQETYMKNHRLLPQIFLQHGVTDVDVSTYINGFVHENCYVIASTQFEKEAFEKLPYIIPKGHVMMTGMPRFDRLESEPKGLVIIALTWRMWLRNVDEAEFKNSDYYLMTKKILLDDDLIDAVERKGYKIVYKLHPQFERFRGYFELSQRVLEYNGTYGDCFKEGNLLITDYSSLAFDFAYLGKPVIYYHFDEDDFWKKHSTKKGNFDFYEMGLGPVVKDHDELKNRILNYVNNNTQMDDMYKKRLDKMFMYHDRNNSRRVYESIMEILNGKKIQGRMYDE